MTSAAANRPPMSAEGAFGRAVLAAMSLVFFAGIGLASGWLGVWLFADCGFGECSNNANLNQRLTGLGAMFFSGLCGSGWVLSVGGLFRSRGWKQAAWYTAPITFAVWLLFALAA